jgi:hypothetical protein
MMSIPLLFLLVITVAFLFFGLIPGIGAFSVRSHWRNFRRRMLEVSLFPFVQYSDVTRADKSPGNFRLFGRLEAIQADNRIWVNSGSFTMEVDLTGVQLYTLPSYGIGNTDDPFEKLEETLPDRQPQSISWNRITSLPAGIQVFVAGSMYSGQGHGIFRSQPKVPLMVVIYDGDERSILLRAVWGGRQKNEYWNSFTLAALITGSVSLFLMSYLFLSHPLYRQAALFALTLGFFPLATLLPPGVLFNFVYRYLWKRARLLRAQRDLFRLPLRYFQGKVDSAAQSEQVTPLPTGEQYIMTRDASVSIRDPVIIRGSGFLEKPPPGDYVVFGVRPEAAEPPALIRPRDPMAELVLVLGNPEILARICDRRARILELFSALFAFAGIAVNLFFLLYLWQLIIR